MQFHEADKNLILSIIWPILHPPQFPKSSCMHCIHLVLSVVLIGSDVDTYQFQNEYNAINANLRNIMLYSFLSAYALVIVTDGNQFKMLKYPGNLLGNTQKFSLNAWSSIQISLIPWNSLHKKFIERNPCGEHNKSSDLRLDY